MSDKSHNISRRPTAEEIVNAILLFIAETGDLLYDQGGKSVFMRTKKIAQSIEATIVVKYRKRFSLFVGESDKFLDNKLLVEIKGTFIATQEVNNVKAAKIAQSNYNSPERKGLASMVTFILTNKFIFKTVVATKRDWLFSF